MSVYDEYQPKAARRMRAVHLVKKRGLGEDCVQQRLSQTLDAALAKRRDELWGVKIRGNLYFGPIQVAECDTGLSILFITAGSARHTSGG